MILGAGYGMPIDMWSFACILIELYNGLPVFPGENEHEQMACFLEVLGMPDVTLLERSQRKRIFFDSRLEPRQMINSRGRRRRINGKSLEKATTSNDGQFIDFIKGCLTWDPEERMTPMQAIRHEWISKNKSKSSSSKRDSGMGE